MKAVSLALLASVVAAPLLAQETRQMDAHVHGVSTLELAIEDSAVEIRLLSPGMDIVGFEHAASSEADQDAVEVAVKTLAAPENVVTLPEAAECRLTEIAVHLHSGEHDHEHEHEHEHEEGADHAHAEDHAHTEGEGEDHAHTEGEKHEHAEEDHKHAEGEAHAEGATHSEFHATYAFTCAHPEELTSINFPFFAQFENAQKIGAQYVTAAGAGSAEIGRDAAELTLD